MIDFIYGMVGAWLGYASKKGSESKLVRPRFRPLNGIKVRKYPIEIPENLITTIEQPGDYPGQFRVLKVIRPDKNSLPDIDFESTPFARVFGSISDRVMQLEKEKQKMNVELTHLEKTITMLKSSSNRRPVSSDEYEVCDKCNKKISTEQLKKSGGFCTTPGCNNHIKAS